MVPNPTKDPASRSDGLGSDQAGFEEIYARAGSDLAAVPWASLTASPALVAWLDGQPRPSGHAALVVGCGLGDDAQELDRRGYTVTAFDVSPTAIERCTERFPRSTVDYRVADLFVLPDAWRAAFDLVVEIRTLQSLPPSRRSEAAAAIAATVRPGGRVFVRCLARDDREPLASRPWPVSLRELGAFADAGLDEVELREEASASGRARFFTALYARAGVGSLARSDRAVDRPTVRDTAADRRAPRASATRSRRTPR